MGCPTCRCPLQTKPFWLGGGSAERLQQWYLLQVDVCHHPNLRDSSFVMTFSSVQETFLTESSSTLTHLGICSSASLQFEMPVAPPEGDQAERPVNVTTFHTLTLQGLCLCAGEKSSRNEERKKSVSYDETSTVHMRFTKIKQAVYRIDIIFHFIHWLRLGKTKKWNPIESSLKSHGQSCSVLFSALHLYLCFGEVAARSFHCLEVTCQLTWKMCSGQMVSDRNHLRHSSKEV